MLTDAIQGFVNLGNNLATQILGQSYVLARPDQADITRLQPCGTVQAYMTTDADSKSIKANPFGKAYWYGRFDTTNTQAGDYLAPPVRTAPSPGLETYFIAAQPSLLATLLVRCNAVVSFARPAGEVLAGGNPYGGSTPAIDTPLAAGWPASVLIKTRGEAGQVALPGDVKLALFEVLLPPMPGVTLRTSDLMADDLGRNYTLSAAELTDLGWRLYAQLEAT